MKKARQLICIVLALVMIFGVLAGCAKQEETQQPTANTETEKNNTETTPETPTEGTEESTDKALEDYTEPMELIAYLGTGTIAPGDTENNGFVSYVRDALKIDMSKTQFNNGENLTEKLGLMIASGEMPDVICMWYSPENKALAQQFIDAGMLLDVTDYLTEEKCPNLVYDYADTTLDAYRNSDGRIYMISSQTVNPEHAEIYSIEPNMTFWMRTDLFNELGLEAPTTPDELYDALVALKNAYGKDNESFTPLTSDNGSFLMKDMLPAMFGVKTHRCAMNEAEGRFVDEYEYPEYLEYLKFAARIYREGLLDPTILTNTYDTWQADTAAGNWGVGVCYPNIPSDIASLQENVEGADAVPFAIPKAEGVEKTDYWQSSTIGGMITLVSKNVSDPDRVMKFLDWGCSKVGWMSTALGGPGYYWDFNEDGEPVYNFDYVVDPNEPSNMAGSWVYMLTGRLLYLRQYYGFANVTEPAESETLRMQAREYNIPETLLDPEIEMIQAIPVGPIQSAKQTAVDKVVENTLWSIITEAKDDAEVESMYQEMLENVKAAGATEIQQEKYERYLLWKDGKLED